MSTVTDTGSATGTANATDPFRPLADVKVLDLARVLSGPYCASLLADLGADVVKVEIPGHGDDSRAFAPFLHGESCYFMLVNRGKKSVTLDLKSDEGRELLLRLAAKADVVVENFRPGVTARLGIDYDALRAVNPSLIYISISGFGQSGPFAHRPAYDHIVQAMGGIMSVTGWPDGPPTRVGDAVGDVVAGLYGAFGVLAALIHRHRSGKGHHVDVAMLDTMMSLQMVGLSQVTAGNGVPDRVGNAHSGSAPMDSFAAADGHVVIAVANNGLFARLAGAIERPDLVADPRFTTDALRIRHRKDLGAVIQSWTSIRSIEAIVDILEIAGIPVAPIWDLEQALASDHARHRRLLRETRRPNGGTFAVMPQPVQFDGVGPDGDFAAPTLGADTLRVLQNELGLTDAQLTGLRERGVI